jgi:hypothetical protein
MSTCSDMCGALTSVIDRSPGRGKKVASKRDIRSHRIVVIHCGKCCLGDDVNCDVHGYYLHFYVVLPLFAAVLSMYLNCRGAALLFH